MEPKYYAFLEVIGHPNRSSSENMTIDAEGMLTTHDRTLPTLASLASVSSTASPLPRFFNKGRMVFGSIFPRHAVSQIHDAAYCTELASN